MHEQALACHLLCHRALFREEPLQMVVSKIAGGNRGETGRISGRISDLCRARG